MDEGTTPNPYRPNEADTDPPGGEVWPADSSAGEEMSPFAPRPAEKPLELPNVSNRDQLRLATSAIVQQGLTLSEAAEKYDVDPDTLFIWHRTYINFIGRDTIALNKGATPESSGFDRETSRKFDKNWAEMLRIWELERPQLSPFRKRLLASPFTRWMFRDEKIDKITVTGALAVLAFTGLAIRGGTTYLGSNTEPATGDDPTVTTTLDPSNPDSFKGKSQQANLTKVADALQEFAKLETWQERLPFIRSPEVMKPLMADYYKSHPDGPLDQLTLNPQVSFIQREDAVFVLLQGQFTPKDAELGEVEQVIFLAEAQATEPAFLFDWEVMVNYEPVPWEEFIASKSTTPAQFRLRVAKGDYYNQPFMDSDKYASYVLLPLHRQETAYGFVERNTPLARQLEENIAKELHQNRAMILTLKFPDNPKFGNVVEIESLVSDGWLEED